jgi:hypothetical protein
MMADEASYVGPRLGHAADEEIPNHWCYGKKTGPPAVVLLISTCSILSALLFVTLVNRPVYDDVFNIFDVHAYAQNGVTVSSVVAQRNAPGPASFIWMAAGVHLLGDGELRDARVAVLASWVLLAVATFCVGPRSGFPQLWYGALLAAMVFPHSATATATLLTEGPALLFAMLGVLAWTEAVSRPKTTSAVFLLGMVGALGMGLATISRQYNLALLPAAAGVGLYQLRWRSSRDRSIFLANIILSLTVAATPLLILVFVWKGITSPSMAAGTSYETYHASVGLNFLRPIVASFCVGFNLIPLTFPAMLLQSNRRWPALVAAMLIALLATSFRAQIVNIGVLHSVIRTLSRLPIAGTAAFGFIAILVIYNAIAFGLLLWDKRAVVREAPPVMFALLMILFYIGEQLGVGGNIPFYDRYVLPLAPFVGLIVFSVIPKLNLPRVAAFIGMFLFSQVLLWRFVFVR